MNILGLIICAISFIILIKKIKAEGYYSVIGPRVIRPNSEYHCAVSIQDATSPTRVIANIQGISQNGTSFLEETSAFLQPFTSKILRFMIEDLEPGHYKLVVSGTGGIDFAADYPLDYAEKSYSVFIQTDRSIYKPGSVIQFRAIVLNAALKPAAEVRNEFITIYISDGKGDRVKEWRRVEAVRGVFSEELELGKAPVLGQWKISVVVHGQTYNKTIDVANYILPKFIISIEAPKHVIFSERYVTAIIKSQYSYGKNVKGTATVTAYPTIFSGVIQPIFKNPVRKVMPIDGSLRVEFDIENELGLNDEYERPIIIDVIIEESLTGRRQNNSIEVHLHKYPYNMELVKTADYFKPGLPYEAYVKINNHDGTPLSPNNEYVTVRHGYSRADEVYQENQHKLDKNGVVKLTYYTPRKATNATALRIEAQYHDLKERISPIPASVSFSNTFLEAKVITERPIVNLEIEIMVNCTERMNYINYVLMGRGDVLLANTFEVDSSNEFKFHFTATHAMVPISHLIVYYVKPDGELIGDSVDIETEGLLQNFIDIQTITSDSQPSRDMEIKINARPNSYIGLMAVDEQVGKLGKADYDLSYTSISNELQSYDFSTKSPYALIMKDNKYHFPWKQGSSNPHSAVYESGADLLTNAHIYRHKPTLEDIYIRPIFYGSSTVKPDLGFGLPIHSVTRPPLAGPYAFSRIPKPVWNQPKVYLPQNIADTWLFANFSSGFDGKTSIRRRIPNSLNTWTITGFSLDPLHGLGLATNPKTLKVTKSFEVNIDLPYSMQRGEILAVPVVVTNRNDQDMTVEVTIHNSEKQFEFADMSNEVKETRKNEDYRRKRLSVRKNSSSAVSFIISPLMLGNIEIKVTASSPNNQDMITKNLKVIANGETEHYTKTLLIDLRRKQTFKGNVTVSIPKNFVHGTDKLEVSAVGDILGPTMINLENLIQLPTGCGEQNLIHFLPNVIILRYLRSTRQLTPTIENNALKLLEISYQQQLAFKRDDGSFSVFGFRDTNGSVWLTAYTALAMKQARPFIYVDKTIITNALQWLIDHQGYNGSFYETAPVIHEDLQGQNGNSLALTAFVVLAFIENQNTELSYTQVINKGLDYIARNIDDNESTYSIALCSYVLQLAKHSSMTSGLNLLNARAKLGENRKWWTADTEQLNEKNPWNKLPRTKDIETTSYALLTLIEGNYIDDAVLVLDWLLDQQNEFGGFTSSHDTVIGLYAISKLVSVLSGRANMQIDISYRQQDSSQFSINQNNALIVQRIPIQWNDKIKEVNVTASGTGIGLVKVSYRYNKNVTGPWPLFTLDPQVDKNSNPNHLQVSICTAFVSHNLTHSSNSDMAVMEVNLPSGFTADIDSLPSLEVSQNVQKVQLNNDGTKVILYFNNVTRIEYCPTVSAFRTHKVAKQKPVAVVMYDYYDSSRRARVFYNGPRSTLCDICEEEDCSNICVSDPNKQVSGTSTEASTNSGSRIGNVFASLIFVIFLIIKHV